jgi:putative FmdB family regulatory protein
MTYVYKCPPCDHTFEVSKSIHQSDTPEYCEKCGREGVKQIQAAPFHLKGKGWHNTDYGKRGRK